MFDCFNKTPKPEVNKPTPPIGSDSRDNRRAAKIGLLVGHNASSQGAYNYLGESEFSFGNRIFNKALKRLEDEAIAAIKLQRPSGSYTHQVNSVRRKAVELDLQIILSSHFNAASSSSATGCETLVRDTQSPIDNKIGFYFAEQIHKRFGIVKRGDNGVKTLYKGHNGFGMVDGLYSDGIYCIILEPCFATNRETSKRIFEHEDEYVDIIVDTVKYALTLIKEEAVI